MLSSVCTLGIDFVHSGVHYGVVFLKKAWFYQWVLYINFRILGTDFMKKTWFVLPGYCVGLGGLLLITYRTILAISSPEKAILVSVNRFGEQYLDLVALAFLWVVCLVGLLCLSSFGKEMNRGENLRLTPSDLGGVGNPMFSFDVRHSFHQPSAMDVMGDAREGLYLVNETSLSADEMQSSVSVSVVIQQEDSQG